MKTDALQLYRSSKIYTTHKEALDVIDKLTLQNGQPAVFRYFTSAKQDEIRAILVVQSIKNSVSTKTVFDVEATEEAIKNAVKELRDKQYVKDIKDEKAITNTSAADVDIYTVIHDKSDNTEPKTYFKTIYHPISPAGSVVPKSVGDIEKGMTVEELAGRPISQIIDDLIFETIYPKVRKPFVESFNFNVYTTVTKDTKVAEANITGPTSSQFISTFNRGTSVIEAATIQTVPYSGVSNGNPIYTVSYTPHSITNTAMTSQDGTAKTDSNVFDAKLLLGTYTYKVTINYNAGVNILDSKGKKCPVDRYLQPDAGEKGTENPKSAGSVTSTFNVTTTLPAYITVSATGTANLVKQAAQAWGVMTFGGNKSVNWPDTSPASPIILDLPRRMNTCHSFNEVSGAFDVNQKSSFTESTVTKSINGKDYKYYRYTWSGGALGKKPYKVTTL